MAPRTVRLVPIAVALLFLLGAGCGSTASAPGVTYSAAVTTDPEFTDVQLARLTDVGGESLDVEFLGSAALGYGGLPFVLGQGSVPKTQVDVPAGCLASDTLGIDMANPCVIAPLLAGLDSILGEHGLTREDTVLTAQFDTSSSETFTPLLVDDLATRADGYAESLGYVSEIVPEPPDADAGLPPSLGKEAYNHNRDVGFRPRNAEGWMSELKGYARLSALSVPGTHDSICHKPHTLGGSFTQTQSMDIATQLKAGIRFLDIRLKCRQELIPENLELWGFHGSSQQDITFGEILLEIHRFLARNPEEIVFARIKNEEGPYADQQRCLVVRYGVPGNKTFLDAFKQYFDANSLFWKPAGKITGANPDPTLDEMRGKVVVLKDFPGEIPDVNTGLTWDAGNQVLQDEYFLKEGNWGIFRKWYDHARHSLWKAQSNDVSIYNRRIYVNFLSGSGSLTVHVYPWFVASGQDKPNNEGGQASSGLKGCIDDPNFKLRWETFPRGRCVSDKAAKKACSTKGNQMCDTVYLGMNELTFNWLALHPDTNYAGIIVMDFPGGMLIDRIIDVNRRTLLK